MTQFAFTNTMDILFSTKSPTNLVTANGHVAKLTILKCQSLTEKNCIPLNIENFVLRNPFHFLFSKKFHIYIIPIFKSWSGMTGDSDA